MMKMKANWPVTKEVNEHGGVMFTATRHSAAYVKPEDANNPHIMELEENACRHNILTDLTEPTLGQRVLAPLDAGAPLGKARISGLDREAAAVTVVFPDGTFAKHRSGELEVDPL